MGGVLVPTHSSLALAGIRDAVAVRTRGCSPSFGVVMTTRDRASQADTQNKCENTNQISFQTRSRLRSSEMCCVIW